jgi:DNA-binding CsgD family transcriptional regulator
MAVDERTDCEALAAGWEALRAGAWEEARARFASALAARESGEAFEGLAWTGYCLDDEALTCESRERSFRRYREEGDRASAARVAAWLAADCLEFRGQAAVASGWLQRARRLLEGLEPGPDHGWLALHEGSIALDVEEDTATARRLGVEAAELGRRFGVAELEMVGLSLEGRALVSEGELEQGMRRLDEGTAAALAGEAAILVCVGWACCYLISACERVRDYERAAQWCARVREFCERNGIGMLLGLCRAKYASVLTSQGRWREAEDELRGAVQTLAASRPPLAGDALVRLGDLRRRQGRLEEAEELFERCEGHSLSLVGRAAIALERGRADEAAELVERVLRRYPDPERIERAAALELAVAAHLRARRPRRAAEALDALCRIAERVGTRSLRGSARAAEGAVAAARGDRAAARGALEDAVDLLEAAGAPFEAARARRELAGVLLSLGRDEAGRREAALAAAALRDLGAAAEARRAERLLAARPAGDAPSGAAGPLAELTAREREVLGLLAEGLANAELARRLTISEHTVHRHVANILRKLGLASRAAAAALAGRHGLGDGPPG